MVHTGITPSVRIEHESRGLRKSSTEIGERYLVLERYPDDDPSGVRFCVCVHHPEFVQTPTGRSRQEPEIVWRGNDEAAAKDAFATYCTILGGTPPTGFARKAESSGGGASARVAELEKELGRVLARLDELEAAAHKKQ